jgi:hypothetical protein
MINLKYVMNYVKKTLSSYESYINPKVSTSYSILNVAKAFRKIKIKITLDFSFLLLYLIHVWYSLIMKPKCI